MGATSSKKRTKKTTTAAAPEITEADRAVLNLKTQKRKLGAYAERVEKVIAEDQRVAKEFAAQGKKRQALTALRHKKLQENVLKNIDSWLTNVEDMLLNIESAKQEQRLFEALREGTDTLRAIQAQTPVEEVERLMQENAEAADWQRAVDALIGDSLTAEDDALAQQELDELEKELLAAELPEVPEDKLPVKEAEVPTETPAVEGAARAAEEPEPVPA